MNNADNVRSLSSSLCTCERVQPNGLAADTGVVTAGPPNRVKIESVDGEVEAHVKIEPFVDEWTELSNVNVDQGANSIDRSSFNSAAVSDTHFVSQGHVNDEDQKATNPHQVVAHLRNGSEESFRQNCARVRGQEVHAPSFEVERRTLCSPSDPRTHDYVLADRTPSFGTAAKTYYGGALSRASEIEPLILTCIKLESDGLTDAHDVAVEFDDERIRKMKNFECSTCGARFTAKNSLKRHLRIHANHNSFQRSREICRKSGAQFDGKDQYDDNVHGDTKPHSCLAANCNRTFLRKSDMEKHRLHHDIKLGSYTLENSTSVTQSYVQNCKIRRHNCTECGRPFSSKFTLRQHLRTHTGEKPFPCQVAGCGKKFSQKAILSRHLRVHTGEKPYACQWAGCKRRFNQKTKLSEHVRIHTGEKPFECMFAGCEKRFSRKYVLRQHSFLHDRDKPLVSCPSSDD